MRTSCEHRGFEICVAGGGSNGGFSAVVRRNGRQVWSGWLKHGKGARQNAIDEAKQVIDKAMERGEGVCSTCCGKGIEHGRFTNKWASGFSYSNWRPCPSCDGWGNGPIKAQETCPECGHPLTEEVCPFSECVTCEQRVADENRRNARPFDTSPPSPLALRLAESMKDDRRAD